MLRRGRQGMGKKGKEKELTNYKRLVEGAEEQASAEKCPKGYVPVIVGRDPVAVERFLVRVKLFKDPCIVVLLEMAEDELGDRQQGILRIPCDVEHFRRVVDAISKAR